MRRLVSLIALLALPLSAVAQEKDTDKASEKWDVQNPPGTHKDVQIDVQEGTWMSLDVSPDGKTIAFDLLGDIYTMPSTGGEATAIASGLAWEIQPRFSPDGSKIAFISDRAGGENVWIMDIDGENPRQLTKESFHLLNNPSWSPDGQYITARKHFTTRRSLGTGEVWLYHVTGGTGLKLVKRPNDQFQKEQGEPIFSPDGRYIYFTRNASPGNRFIYAQDSNTAIFEIRRYDMESGEVDTIVSGPGGAVRPTPSPDGKYLAFVRRIRTRSALFLKDLQSGAEYPIHDDLDQDMQETWATQGVYPNMDWMPDSQSLLFWAGGKINRIDVGSRTVSQIPFHVADSRSVIAPPRFKVEVAPDQVAAKMVRFAAQSPDGKQVVYEAFGKLWIKNGDNPPQRLTRDEGAQFELFPAFSRDGKNIAFVTWDDTELGRVRMVKASGGKSKVLNDQPGHYRRPVFSPDGSMLVVERGKGGYLTADTWSMEPGLYRLSIKGGEMVKITDKGRNAHFGKSGDRLFFTTDGKDHELVSTTLDGRDKRVHASAKYGTGFAVSPDGQWLAYSEGYQIYAMPFPPSGKLTLSPKAKAVPMTRVTKSGGAFMTWSAGNQLGWSIGPKFQSVAMTDVFADDFAPSDDGITLSITKPADKPQGMVALTGARIITMNGDDAVIENGTILIEENRIKAIGPNDDIDIPADAKRVDVSGKTILPGFVDIHAHGSQGVDGIIPQQNWDQLAHLGLGVTTVHDPSNTAQHVFAASEYQRAGLILSPRTFSTGEILYGAKSEYLVDIKSAEDARNAVKRLKAQGAISVKNYNQPRREQRQMVVDAARQEGLMVVAEGGSLYHMDLSMVADGNTGIEHNVPGERFYEDVLQFWSQTEVGNTPTLVVTYGGLSAETLFYQRDDVWTHPLLSKYVPPHILEPRSIRRTKAPMRDYQTLFDSVANAKRLMDRGVSIHSGAHGQREGMGTHWEIWTFVKGGMTNMDALKAATINPARYMGMDGDIGSLESNKLADLIILDNNPLEDIEATDDLNMIMLNGRLYDAETLDETITGDHDTKPFYWQN
ncbi:TolB protein [Iodidimonas gelatinilytica]|uniref:TolB protein n=1 Tax=Iodidimonas gelatinilytica TaxID=1236966 RepID=A0A5A7MZH5_9PROT|nr:amidohydrolase family protein [Iodidimonas gelatinilytica]GER01238.1 TolB protein [Iodidimonas gelatinilytica]